MIKFKDKALIGGTWFDRGMVAEFDAKTEADLIAEGDAVAYVIEVSGTIENANHALTADTATNATNAVNATNAINAQNAITADSATNAGHATTADNATTAQTAVSANSAASAATAGYAATAETAGTAGHATTADTATTAGHATTATSATTADTATNADTAAIALSATTAATAESSLSTKVVETHPYYHFHGFAGNQFAGDGKFFDLSGINHGIRGANLSDAQMFANPGYVTTADPVAGAADSTIHIPNINFDYAGGEKLIVWWLGAGTPEATDAPIIGDGWSTAVGQHGWRIRMKPDGKFDATLWGADQRSTGSSHAVVFDGTLHSLAVCFDGAAGAHGMWSDEEYHTSFSAASFAAFTAGVDTLSANTVNIGASRPALAASGAAGDGASIKTRALVIIRLPASYTMPLVGQLTSVFQQLRANPGSLILASAF